MSQPLQEGQGSFPPASLRSDYHGEVPMLLGTGSALCAASLPLASQTLFPKQDWLLCIHGGSCLCLLLPFPAHSVPGAQVPRYPGAQVQLLLFSWLPCFLLLLMAGKLF